MHFDCKWAAVEYLKKKYPELIVGGRLTKALVQVAPGIHLVGASSVINWNEWCEIWSRVNKVKCIFDRLDRKVFEDTMGPLGGEIADMFQVSE